MFERQVVWLCVYSTPTIVRLQFFIFIILCASMGGQIGWTDSSVFLYSATLDLATVLDCTILLKRTLTA